MSANVKVRYFKRGARAESFLEAFLEKSGSVEDVKVDPETGMATFRYAGSYKNLVALESQTVRAGVPTALFSHAYLVVAWKPGKGADLESLRTALAGQAGMQNVCCVNGKWGDFYVNLAEFDLESMLEAIRGEGFSARAQSHEMIRIEVTKGEIDDLLAALSGYRKSLLLEQDGESVKILAKKTLTDSAIRAAAAKAKVVIKRIVRVS